MSVKVRFTFDFNLNSSEQIMNPALVPRVFGVTSPFSGVFSDRKGRIFEKEGERLGKGIGQTIRAYAHTFSK